MQLQITNDKLVMMTCAIDVRQRCSPYVHAALADYTVEMV